MFLLDTNVVSEALRPKPAPQVVAWLDGNFAENALSSIAIFELRAGVALLSAGQPAMGSTPGLAAWFVASARACIRSMPPR